MNSSLDQRVAQLEKNLRFYRFAFAGLVIVVIGFVSLSFRNKYVPDVIEARAFNVVDANGKKLVSLFSTDGGAGGINTFGKNGEVLFKVTNTIEGGGYMALFNGQMQEVAELGVTQIQSGYFRLNDRAGKKQAWFTYTQDGGGYFSLSNEGQEMIRFSTPAAGGRVGIYNNANTRVLYMGVQDTKEGNVTVWNAAGTRIGGVPAQ